MKQDRHASDTTDPFAFLPTGSAMADQIRGHDWAATHLGPPETWPESLRAHLEE